MTRAAADPCDGCAEELGDTFTAVGKVEPIFVCDRCLPIVTRVDRLVDLGRLDANDAAAEFTRLRWSADDRGPRGSRGGGDRDVSGVCGDELLAPAEGACSSTC